MEFASGELQTFGLEVDDALMFKKTGNFMDKQSFRTSLDALVSSSSRESHAIEVGEQMSKASPPYNSRNRSVKTKQGSERTLKDHIIGINIRNGIPDPKRWKVLMMIKMLAMP